ncbi:TIGR01906 family membrane protein [Lactobacillus equicursoris]|uniref:TIGR01906 family membrane protein n=1 Tax=Lactobacillus equicursoris TaxID=420645 RepID=UPI0039959353
MKKQNKSLVQILLPFGHFFFALASAVLGAIIVSWPLLLFFTFIEKSYQTVNLTIGQVMANYNQLLWYLVWPWKKKLLMTNLPTSASAASHFAEVKNLFILCEIVFLLGLALGYYFKQKKESIKLNQTWALLLMILPIVVLPFALTNFDSFFRVFHTLIFHNSNWLFDPETDPVINVLTEGFFAACFAVGGVIYELYFARFLLNK